VFAAFEAQLQIATWNERSKFLTRLDETDCIFVRSAIRAYLLDKKWTVAVTRAASEIKILSNGMRRAIINARQDINEDTYIRFRFDEINIVIEDKDDKGDKE